MSIAFPSSPPLEVKTSGRDVEDGWVKRSMAEQASSVTAKDAGESASDEYLLFCSSDRVREQLLSAHALVLKQASEAACLRLHCATDDNTSLPSTALCVPKLQKALTTRAIGHVIVYSDAVPSTQDLLRSRFRGLPDGAVAIASRQTSGRGRRGSEWETPLGSVAFSIHVALPMSAPERLTFVQYVAALAAVECMRRIPDWSCVPIRIKWPNDLYVNGCKVGGVLCEAATQGHRFDVVVGVGVNILNPKPTSCLESARVEHGGLPSAPMTREAFLAEYLNSFEELYDEFSRSDGFQPLKERYINAWLHSGQQVRLEAHGGRLAEIVGLAPNGFVRLRFVDNDSIVDIAPDVTSLDLSGGVIREKVVGPSTR